MKAVRVFVIVLLCGFIFSCNKSNTTSTPSSTMSATINGSSITFSSSFSNGSGTTVLTGSSSSYTLHIYLQLAGAGTYMLGASSTNNYATVTDNFGNSYTTTASNTGQVLATAGSSSGLYNGTFNFSANGTTSINVTNGQFSNM